MADILRGRATFRTDDSARLTFTVNRNKTGLSPRTALKAIIELLLTAIEPARGAGTSRRFRRGVRKSLKPNFDSPLAQNTRETAASAGKDL